MASFVSSSNVVNVFNPRKHKLQLVRDFYSLNFNGPIFTRSKGRVRKKQSSVVRLVTTNQDIDFTNPDWIKQYQEDFESRFNLPHLRDVLDIEPRPTTFSLNGR